MAFLIYKKSVAGANILCERLMPLKLGGRAGLIAGHVKTLPSGDTGSWNLATTTLLKRAGFATNVDETGD